MITIILFLIFVVYYALVVCAIFEEKYCNSPIQTKKDLLFALIPFQMIIKQLILAIKDLD